MAASHSLRLLGMCLALAALALSVGMSGTAHAAESPVHTRGNSAAAQACQQGGYQYYESTNLTVFTSPGECTSYAALGSTPQPVPDLQLNHSCSPGDHPSSYVSCTFSVTNIGAGPTVGGETLSATLQTSDGTPLLIDCPSPSCVTPPTTEFTDYGGCTQTGGSAGYVVGSSAFPATAWCADSIPAGGTSPVTVTITVTPQNPGTSIVVSASVALDQPSQEPNQSNNTFSATYATSGPTLVCCG